MKVKRVLSEFSYRIFKNLVVIRVSIADCSDSGAQLQECQEPMARTLLNISKWLQQDQKHVTALVGQLGLRGQGDGTEVTVTAANLASLLAREDDIRKVDGDGKFSELMYSL